MNVRSLVGRDLELAGVGRGIWVPSLKLLGNFNCPRDGDVGATYNSVSGGGAGLAWHMPA